MTRDDARSGPKEDDRPEDGSGENPPEPGRLPVRADSTSVADRVADLGLVPHPEGGHYREIYRSPTCVTREGADRSAMTIIHFLLRRGERSRWHVVRSDEAWQYVDGAPLELLEFDPAQGRLDVVSLGSHGEGSCAVHVIAAGHWQAARTTGDATLVACTVAPGFEFDDFAFVDDLAEADRVFEGVLADYRDLR